MSGKQKAENSDARQRLNVTIGENVVEGSKINAQTNVGPQAEVTKKVTGNNVSENFDSSI